MLCNGNDAPEVTAKSWCNSHPLTSVDSIPRFETLEIKSRFSYDESRGLPSHIHIKDRENHPTEALVAESSKRHALSLDSTDSIYIAGEANFQSDARCISVSRGRNRPSEV